MISKYLTKFHMPITAGSEAVKKLIIITAPSGAGKTSITKYLIQKIPQLAFSVSATTRVARENEIEGKDYFFMKVLDFNKKIKTNEFIEWEMVYEGKYYGTLKKELVRLWQNNQYPLLDIDVKGAINVQQQYPTNSLSIFIDPPSVNELRKRLLLRKSEDEASLQIRLNKAEYELSFISHFDKVVINDDFDRACTETETIVKQFLHIL